MEKTFDKTTTNPLPIFIRELRDQIRANRKTKTRRIVKTAPHLGPIKTIKFKKPHIEVEFEHQKPLYALNCPYGVEGEVRYLREPLVNRNGFAHYADDGAGVLSDGQVVPWRWKRNSLPQIHMPKNCARTFCVRTTTTVERVNTITAADAIAEGITYDKKNGYKFYGEELERLNQWTSNPIWSFETLWQKIHAEPTPIYSNYRVAGPCTGQTEKRREIVSYTSHPWSNEDFDAAYPGARAKGRYRGKPLTVLANPWVWVIGFKKV